MRYEILLGVPSSGTIHESAAQASYHASLRHQVHRLPSTFSGPNYNAVWNAALNSGMEKRITHFAMMHTDIQIQEDEADTGTRWLDRMVEEMDKVNADFISTPIAIKDALGLTSCGIGNPENRWNPWRRFCVCELENMPMTFNAKDVGYGDKFLIHNHALCLWDMRKPCWYQTDENNRCQYIFNLEEDIRLENGKWVRYFHSEDWFYSRCMWKMNVNTYITRVVKVIHHGGMGYSNYDGSGLLWQDGDEATASQWRVPGAPVYKKKQTEAEPHFVSDK